MAAIVMASIRMSVPEDPTIRVLVPLLLFAVLGVWMATLRGSNTFAGGAAGGVVGAVSNVATQWLYYHYLRFDTEASVIYLGPEITLIIEAVGGLILGVLLGAVVRLTLWLGAKARTKHAPKQLEPQPSVGNGDP
jgi:hypothetical protein